VLHEIQDTCRRLTAIRKALKLGERSDAARILGVSNTRYHNWETGVGLIPVDQAIKLKEMFGVTLDFLYAGDQSALPLRVVEAIRSLPPEKNASE
jgi:transcriptional regulator with XRE-family HTH domain